MIKVTFKKEASGKVIALTPDNIDNYDIIDGLTKTGETNVKVALVDGTKVDAKIIYSEEECKYHLIFEKYTVVGKGSCIEIEGFCSNQEDCFSDCAKVEAVLTDKTKIPVLDENGCPTNQFTTVEALRKTILGSDCIVAEGNRTLGTSDSIVVVDSECNLKRISPDDLCCRKNTGKVDCNECP